MRDGKNKNVCFSFSSSISSVSKIFGRFTDTLLYVALDREKQFGKLHMGATLTNKKQFLSSSGRREIIEKNDEFFIKIIP